MYEQDVEVSSRNGPIPSFAVAPDGPGPYPGIIVYMDAPGIREELRNIARRIAKHGYYVLMPDMYYRLGQVRLDFGRRADGFITVMRAAMNSLTNKLVMDDTAACIAFMEAQDRVKAGPMGCIGYCMSGQYVTTAAARFPNHFAASASLYGVGIVTDKDDTPHKLVERIKGEIYYGFAEIDETVPPEVIPTLTDALKAAEVSHTIDVFSGSRHGFQFPEREAYHVEAAEGAWAKIFAMWERRLKV